MLQRSLEQQIFDNRKIGYAIIDHSLRIVETGGHVDILSPLYDDLEGRSLPECVPEVIGNEAELEAILSGELDSYLLPMINRTVAGKTTYVDVASVPYVRNDLICGILFIVEDMSELGLLKQAVTQQRNELALMRDKLSDQNMILNAANVELRYLDEAKSKFVSIAAHELRSPLASISGYSELLMDSGFGTLTGQQLDFVKVIERSAQRLLETVSNLLDMSRIEAGHIELDLCPTNLASILEVVATEYDPQVQAKDQQVMLHVEPGCGYALCDERRVIQILGNLLANAVKYAPTGSAIEIRVALATDKNFIQISVSDQGIGIPVEDQARLYDSFFRAGNVHQSMASGAGLGLNIVKSLVELHGGAIECESEPGVGTTFSFTLPVDDGLVVMETKNTM